MNERRLDEYIDTRPGTSFDRISGSYQEFSYFWDIILTTVNQYPLGIYTVQEGFSNQIPKILQKGINEKDLENNQ